MSTAKASRIATSNEAWHRKRTEEAAEFCAVTVVDGWASAVADRALKLGVTEQTWNALFRSRRYRHCTVLADMAEAILSGQKAIHDMVGSLVRWLVAKLGGGRLEQAHAREIAAGLPLPTDAKMVSVARGLQVTGVLLCVVDGRELSRCACFRAIALDETKSRVKEILSAAVGDWMQLAKFVPSAHR